MKQCKPNFWMGKLSRSFEVVALIGSIFGMIVATFMFMNGFHNIDLCWNYSNIVTSVNDISAKECNGTQILVSANEMTDTGVDYQSATLTEYYISGVNQMRKGFFVGLFSSVLLGLMLGRIFNY